MTAPNERFAVDILRILDPDLVTATGRPDRMKIIELEQTASTGERALLDAAMEAWRCNGGFARIAAVCDAATVRTVLAALNAAYTP